MTECCSCGCERDVDAYWREPCLDAPTASSAPMTRMCDAWGWATSLLGIKGQLQRMRTEGYASFVGMLLGCCVGNQNGMEGFEGSGGAVTASLVAMCLQHAADRRPSLTAIARLLGQMLEGQSFAGSWWSEGEGELDLGGTPMRYVWRAGDEVPGKIVAGRGSADEVRQQAQEVRAATAGQAFCEHAFGHTSTGVSWIATRRLVRVLQAHGDFAHAEEQCVILLGAMVDASAPLVLVGEAQMELACVLLRLCRCGGNASHDHVV